MEWWLWLLVALVVMAALVGGFALIQARRREGGVVLADASTSSPRTGAEGTP